MSTFLSNLLNTAEAVEREKVGKPAPETPRHEGSRISPEGRERLRRGSQARSAKTQAKYAKVFAEPITVAEASAILDISHVACNVQLYRYEKRELVRRVGKVDDSLQTLWKWIGK